MDSENATEIKRGLKAEALLDPLTRRRRDTAFKVVTENIDTKDLYSPAFVHYTSADSAISIIENKSLWMRNAMCMEDWSEVKHGHQILCRFFEKNGRRNRFRENCSLIFKDSGLRALSTFDEWSGKIQSNTYIASVSEHREEEDNLGRLSMWRAFGGSETRVAFVFRPPPISDATALLKVQMRPVLYETEIEIHNNLDLMISNIQQEADFFHNLGEDRFVLSLINTFIGLTVGVKHSAFAEEREWRLIHLPAIDSSELMLKEVKNIRGVPQLIYRFPLNSEANPLLTPISFHSIFERLIIGPTLYGWPVYEAFVKSLEDTGIADAKSKVWVSNIPLR